MDHDVIREHLEQGGGIRVTAPRDGLEPPGDLAVIDYCHVLRSLPWPREIVRLPDGRLGEVVEVLRHAGREPVPPSHGRRVALHLQTGNGRFHLADCTNVRCYDPQEVERIPGKRHPAGSS